MRNRHGARRALRAHAEGHADRSRRGRRRFGGELDLAVSAELGRTVGWRNVLGMFQSRIWWMNEAPPRAGHGSIVRSCAKG